ncbi:gamma-glutamyltransferase, partial [Phormidium pseudopriestleyi FRX01]
SDCNRLGSTTHISIMDREGNAASVTTSNGEGSSYIIPGTGIMVNNMLGEADLNPNGFHQWPENQRLSSMMAPTMVLKENRPEIVLGSGGSNRIRTAILQVICNVIDFNLDLATAIESPRVHWENGVFHLEPGFDTKELESLSNLMPKQTQDVIKWVEKNMFFGGVNGVRMRGDGEIEAAGDPRRNGAIAPGQQRSD